MAKGNPNPSPATRFSADKQPETRGRSKDSRDKLSRAFLAELAADFEANGKVALETVRANDPSTYIRVIASLQPKELEITDPMKALSDDKLTAAIEALNEMLKTQAPAPPPAAPPPAKDKPSRTVN